MTALAKGWDFAAAGLAEMEKSVTRARNTFNAGTLQRQKARDELAALPAGALELRQYIDAQSAANPGTQWADLKQQKDLLIAAFQALQSEMEARITADEAV